MTTQQQLVEWLNGHSIHNEERKECCPDFSCCRPHLLAPFAIRKEFYTAWCADDDKSVNRLLMQFLGRMLSDTGHDKDTKIIG